MSEEVKYDVVSEDMTIRDLLDDRVSRYTLEEFRSSLTGPLIKSILKTTMAKDKEGHLAMSVKDRANIMLRVLEVMHKYGGGAAMTTDYGKVLSDLRTEADIDVSGVKVVEDVSDG